MQRTVILAGSLREANAYCRDKGIRATFAKSSAQVKQADRLIQLPGFNERRDRFALASARDSHMAFSRTPVELVDESDWVKPKPVEPEPEVEPVDETATASLYEIDLTDETVLEELKRQLNAVGLTLKKLPAKKQDTAVEF